MQSILELDYGYADLDVAFVRKVSFATERNNPTDDSESRLPFPQIVSIVVSQALVNILRPALAILRRLVSTAHSSFGFNAVWPSFIQDQSFLTALVNRITREGDKLLTAGALSLLNAIAKTIPRERLLEVMANLEKYTFRKAVIVGCHHPLHGLFLCFYLQLMLFLYRA